VSGVLPDTTTSCLESHNIVPTGSGIFSINRVAVDIEDKDVSGLAIELVPSWNVDGILTIDGHAPGNVTVRVALSAVGNPSPTYQGISARAVIPKAEDGTFTILNIPQTRYLTEMGAGLPPDLYTPMFVWARPACSIRDSRSAKSPGAASGVASNRCGNR
jgi:hypothetical protein